MTNAEYYLKEGKLSEELIGKMEDFFDVTYMSVKDFWNNTCKPTLTEDERVILRNINKKYGLIKRDNNKNLYVQAVNVEDEEDWNFIDPFNHLFQFIKERRRI